MPKVLTSTVDCGLRPDNTGKVRDIFDLGDRLLIVATDRISAYDVILPQPIPGKVFVELRTDCDQDVILMKVEPQGVGAACHNGYKSCFYREIPLGQTASPDIELHFRDTNPLFDPKQVYKK